MGATWKSIKQAFLSAAGTSRAVLNLGTMHAQGLGIPHHLPEAIRLFEAVAKPSDSPNALAARIALGRLLLSFGNVCRYCQALSWYQAAIALASDAEGSEELQEARAYVARSKTG
jgi:TPR repeat protein